MPGNPATNRQSVLFSFKFLGVSLLGSLTMALVSVFAAAAAQIAVLGSWVSILAGLFLSYVEQEENRDRLRSDLLEKLQIPLSLASERELFDHYCAYSKAMTELATRLDPVLREYANLRLSSISDEVRLLASGTAVFSATETWRVFYQKLLQNPDLKFYKSVAWVKTKDYWQDQPGRQDMRLNYDLVKCGLTIERIVILRGNLWRPDKMFPAPEILPWLKEQYERGIHLFLVSETEICREPDLLMDFGVYGQRATGVEELDEESRPLRFTLFFDEQSIRLSLDRWARLSVYAKPFAEVLKKAFEL